MAVLSVETKKISELEAATTLNANSLFVADMPTVGTQKLAYNDLVGNIKDSLQIPRAADAVPTSAIATEYTNSQAQVAAASQGYDLNARLSVIEREQNCIYGVLAHGIEWTLTNLLAKIRAEKFNDFAIGDYITVSDIKWCVAAKYYWTANELPDGDAPHVVLMPAARLGGQNYKYNSSNTNAGGFNASELATTVTTTLYNALPSALRAACLSVNSYESTKSGTTKYSRKIKLLTERQATGLHFRSTNGGACYEQLPLCRSMSFLGNGGSFWLLDPVDGETTSFCCWRQDYQAVVNNSASSSYGVRPIITIG